MTESAIKYTALKLPAQTNAAKAHFLQVLENYQEHALQKREVYPADQVAQQLLIERLRLQRCDKARQLEETP